MGTLFPTLCKYCVKILYRVISRDVTAAMLVFLNNGKAAMLVSPTNPPGIELYYHANVFFVSVEKQGY